MNDRTKLAALLKNKYGINSTTFINCLSGEEKIKEMLDILLKYPEIIDSDEVYTIAAKVEDIPCKPVNNKLKAYMKKWDVKERTKPWCKDDD